MSVDLAKLAGQGRAFSGSRPWEPEELDAVLALENERGIGRLRAADFVRNGIVTLAAYDKAVKAGFEPKTLNDVEIDVEAALKDNKFAVEVPKEEVAAPAPVEEAPAKDAAPAEETKVEAPAADAPADAPAKDAVAEAPAKDAPAKETEPKGKAK